MGNKIADVAKSAGVSPATVSRVFNRHPYVKEQVRNDVIAAARKLNYAPKSSRSQNSFGIMVRGDNYLALGSYETQMITGISHEFFEHGYNAEIVSDQQISLLHKNSFLALIILSTDVSEHLLETGIPLILVNHLHPATHSVVTDHFQGIELGMEHLIECGHRDIAFISGSSHNWGYDERLNAYKETLAKHNIEYNRYLHVDADKDEIIEAVVRIMKRKPTAIIISGEGRAQHLNHALYLLDKRVPEDVSVVTFEDAEISRYLTPPQTTISQNIPNFAKTVVNLAIEIINDPDSTSNKNIVLDNELIIRESTQLYKK